MFECVCVCEREIEKKTDTERQIDIYAPPYSVRETLSPPLFSECTKHRSLTVDNYCSHTTNSIQASKLILSLPWCFLLSPYAVAIRSGTVLNQIVSDRLREI